MKRLFDIIFSFFFLVLLAPAFLLIAFLIKIESAGPVFFKQKRVGKNESPFYIYKFRSMYLHQHSPSELGPIKHNHALVTPVGYILRRLKLDEIPQLINVLSGSMSLVGPRPCLFDSLKDMSISERRRFNVRPGLTGWAEVNGNVELTWREQLSLDLWYVDHQSFGLDLKILIQTTVVILRGSIRNQKAIDLAESHSRSQ